MAKGSTVSNELGQFNNGDPYHGSEAVRNGRLRGRTDTDYFYFLCPECPGEEVVRVLEYGIHAEASENPYDPQTNSSASHGFTLAFKLHCERCGFTDFTKVSNMGWQGGQVSGSRP